MSTSASSPPAKNSPFAGHPTLGTASWLYWNHPTLAGAERITLHLAGGPVTVRFEPPTPSQPGIYATVRQHDPVFGTMHDQDAVSRATGIPFEDLHSDWPIQTVSTGLPFCIVPLRNQAAVERLEITQGLAEAYLAKTDAQFFYVFGPANANAGAAFHARMQFYNGEDPATGSASGCAIAYLVRHGIVPSGTLITLEQGIEILRPSRIHVQADLTDDRVTNVFVGGRTIPVATGLVSLS